MPHATYLATAQLPSRLQRRRVQGYWSTHVEQATAAARSCFVDVAVQDQRSSLMAKYYKTDKAYQAQNFELTDEYRRITEQFKDLQVPLLFIANRSMSNSLL
jgi:hypothetical protein